MISHKQVPLLLYGLQKLNRFVNFLWKIKLDAYPRFITKKPTKQAGCFYVSKPMVLLVHCPLLVLLKSISCQSDMEILSGRTARY